MSVVDVQEGKDVKCKVELKGEKYVAAKECEFVFYDAAKAELGRQKATVAAGKGECDWKAPALADTDTALSKKATYKVFVGGEEYGGFEEELAIWASEVVVKVLNEAGDAALPEAPVKFTQTGVDPPTTRKSSDAGEVKYPLQKPIDVTAELVSPFELVGWTKGTATTLRNREVKVKRKAYKAAFFTPVWKTDTDVTDPKVHKQYTNLASGNAMKIKVGPASDKDKAAPERLGLKDDVIHVKVTFRATGDTADKNSKRNKPKPCLKVGGTETASPAQVKLGADGEPAEIELELGYAGGDEVTVEIGVTSACADAALKIVTWRKLFYECMAPKSMEADLDAAGPRADGTTAPTLPANHRTKIADILNPTFIEFVCHKTHVFDDDKAGAGTMFDAAYFGKSGRKLHVLTAGWAPTLPTGSAFDGSKGTLGVKFRLADLTFSVRQATKTNSPVLSAATESVVAADASRYLFEYAPKDGTKGTIKVASCEWKAKFARKDDYKVKLTITGPDDSAVPAGSGGGLAVKVQATELAVEETIAFAKSGENVVTALAGGEQTKLDTFLGKAVDAAVAANKPEIKITMFGDRGGIGGKLFGTTFGNDAQTRAANIKDHLTTKHGTNAAAYAHPGLKRDGTEKTGTPDIAWFAHETSSKVKITIPTNAEPGSFIGADSATKCKLTIEFKTEQTYEILGCASNPQVLIFRPSDSNGDASTYVHELAHNMGMTIMPGSSKPSPGMPAAPHVDAGGVYYRNPLTGETNGSNGLREGHSGGHCATGVSDLTVADYGGKGGTCCMFGEGSGFMPLCDVCKRHIKARKLTDISSRWDTRTDEEY